MPNVSELERVRQEHLPARRVELINSLPHIHTKAAKELVLREIRAIERELGIEGLPYNGSEGWSGTR